MVKTLSFATDPKLRGHFVNYWGEVRVGLILEELDRVAGMVGYKHALGKNLNIPLAMLSTEEYSSDAALSASYDLPLTVVTAGVDSIILYKPLAIKKDLRITGRVVLVGRSSMEVLLEVDTVGSDETGQELVERAIEAHYTMVARSPDGKSAVTIPDLQPTTPLEHALYKRAQEHRVRRKQSLEMSLFTHAPQPEEHELLHKLFYRSSAFTLASTSPLGERELANGFVKMANTFRSSVFVMQPQKRNVHNKVFGGYLCRLAFEQGAYHIYCFLNAPYGSFRFFPLLTLVSTVISHRIAEAWSSAYIFSGSLPGFLATDDIAFILPVQLGTMVTFDSTVVYSRLAEPGRYEIVVEVKANVIDPPTHSQQTTNTFFFFFKVPTCDMAVIPFTYQDTIKYLDAKRRLDAITSARQSAKQSAL